jgi:Uma2 family endonuclease
MVAAAPSLYYSYREYTEFEREAREKHEYVAGLILAMAGGTLEHSALCSAVIGSLVTQLMGKACRVFDSNARVRVTASGNAYYPDASVVCGKLVTDAADERAITNPVVLVEALSPTTEQYDRTDKFSDYQKIPSLVHIVHLAHNSKQVDIWTRHEGEWQLSSFAEGQQASLPAIGATLDVSALYRDPLEVNRP